MRIKIGDIWYSCKDQPLMIELTNQDKKNIANMNPECHRYMEFIPTHFTSDEERDGWMDKGSDGSL